MCLKYFCIRLDLVSFGLIYVKVVWGYKADGTFSSMVIL